MFVSWTIWTTWWDTVHGPLVSISHYCCDDLSTTLFHYIISRLHQNDTKKIIFCSLTERSSIKLQRAYLWLVFQIHRIPISFLQDTCMIIVFMLHVQVPSINIWTCHVMSAEFGALNIPYKVTVWIFIPDFNSCCCNAIDSLYSKERWKFSLS